MACPARPFFTLMQCKSPITIKTKRYRDQLIYGEFMQVPCGKCLICQANRRQEIATRLQVEADKAVTTWFVTLTYEDEYLTYGYLVDEDTGEELYLPILNKKELQNYFKKVRINLTRKLGSDVFAEWNALHPLKYFACGEYGPSGHRPHYHFVFLNLPPAVDPIFFSDMWQKGSVTCRQGELNAYAYCGKYMIKHSNMPSYFKTWIIQSNGMGKSYIDENTIKWHTSDLRNRNYIRINGHKVAMPRYIKQKLYSVDDLIKLKYIHNKNLQNGEYEKFERARSLRGFVRYDRAVMDNLNYRIMMNFNNSLKYDSK